MHTDIDDLIFGDMDTMPSERKSGIEFMLSYNKS